MHPGAEQNPMITGLANKRISRDNYFTVELGIILFMNHWSIIVSMRAWPKAGVSNAKIRHQQLRIIFGKVFASFIFIRTILNEYWHKEQFPNQRDNNQHT